jgi:hypothetical protein
MQRIEWVDLFGVKCVEEISDAKGPRKPTRPKGYAATPGTGPEGETCQSCRFKRSTAGSTAKAYWKCKLNEANWTGGPGSDIRMRSPACLHWKPWCHAAQDGDCSWKGCPQIRDGEPNKSGRHCPLDCGDEDE